MREKTFLKVKKFRSCASLHDRIFFIFTLEQKLVLSFE